MRSTRIRAAAAVVTCLAGGALAIGPASNAMAGGTHQAKKPKPDTSHGFFVADRDANIQKVEKYGTESALVRDDNGVEHLVTTQAIKGNANKGHVVYLTRATDKAKWVAHAIPGIIPLNGGVQVEAHLSSNDQRVFAVLYQCDGVYVTDATVGARRLPVPKQVTSLDECADPPAHSDNPPIADAGSTSGRTVSILLPGSAPGSYAIYSGEPTGTFTAGTPLPTADDFTPVQIAADSQYGRIVVIGSGSDGTNKGIYETHADGFSSNWSDPVLVATLDSATTDYKIDTVQTYARHTYIGVEKPSAGKHLAHSLFLIKGSPSGQWLGTVPLPHTNGDDANLRLIVNTSTNHLHAVWTRTISTHKGKSGGIMHESQSSGWGKPTYLTKNWHDVATQITLTASRHPIVGFNQ